MDENYILPFQLQSSNIRGRVVRIGSVLNDVLMAHEYPDPVSHLAGEAMLVCALLSSMLKYEGIFTLQTKGDGPVRMLVSDMVSDGVIRACATYDEEFFAKDTAIPDSIMGEGHIAFTVDQGEHTERYQGIVELKPEGLLQSVQHYFTQSEQIATGIMMAVAKIDGAWRACGVMVQQMPDETAIYNKDQDALHEDDWRRTMILLGSLKDDEMLSFDLTPQDLLYRLFHEEGVIVFDPQSLKKGCRCSVGRIENILSTMSQDDLDDIIVDDKITMTCEFCSSDYVFEPKNFKKDVHYEK